MLLDIIRLNDCRLKNSGNLIQNIDKYSILKIYNTIYTKDNCLWVITSSSMSISVRLSSWRQTTNLSSWFDSYICSGRKTLPDLSLCLIARSPSWREAPCPWVTDRKLIEGAWEGVESDKLRNFKAHKGRMLHASRTCIDQNDNETDLPVNRSVTDDDLLWERLKKWQLPPVWTTLYSQGL